jgi:signal transduction histidine kinase/ActR/RegA family two-component response regulator
MKLPFTLNKLGLIVALALIYYKTAELSRILASTPQNVTPVWPPDGFASAGVFIYGSGALPGVFIGSILSNIWAFSDTTNYWTIFTSILTIIAIAIGTTSGTYLGVTLLKKNIKKPYPFKRIKDTCKFLTYTGIFGTIINSTVGVTALTLNGKIPLNEYGQMWLTWWVSNMSGIFIFTPVLLVWHQYLGNVNYRKKFKKRFHLKYFKYNKFLEIICLVTIIVLISFGSFWYDYSLKYVLIPCLIWANFRFGELAVTNLIVLISIIAVTGTVRDLNNLTQENLHESLIFLQIFIAVIVFFMLIFNAVLEEKAQALNNIKISKNKLYRKNLQIEKYASFLGEQNLKLEEAKQEAIFANKAKSEFLSNISHELRTPLNGILGIAQLLQDQDNLTDKQKDEINIIYESGNHLLLLINDILDISKIEAGKLEIEPNKFDFENFLKLICDISKNSAEAKNLKFNCEISPQLSIIIKSDEKRLRQILLNLLGNGIKFTEKGEVKLIVNPINQFQENNKLLTQIQFKIEDTGMGIPEDKLDKIFLAFEQVGENSFKAQGTGLGLAISQNIAKLMGGNITVSSVLGKGSIFTLDLTFPTYSCSLSPDKSKDKNKIQFDAQLSQKLPFKILLAEDNLVNQKIAVKMFERLGYEVKVCVNGLEVISALEKQFYDIIFMDIQMPLLDGLETTRLIISKYADNICPYIIAMTANAMQGDRENYIEMGMKDYISKPIKINSIIEALYQVKI